MLLSNFIKSNLAYVGFSLLLVCFSSGQARAEDGAEWDADRPKRNESELPPWPSIDDAFKKVLDQVLDNGNLSTSIAQYMEIAPSSHKTRTSVAEFINALWPQIEQDKEVNNKIVHSNSTNQFDPLPKRRPNPMKQVVMMIVKLGKCDDGVDCSALACAVLDKKRRPKKHNRQGEADRRHIFCPCPVPDFCPLPDPCKACPDKPRCPCDEEPKGKLVGDNQRATSHRPSSHRALVWNSGWPNLGQRHSARPNTGQSTRQNTRPLEPAQRPCNGRFCPTSTTGKPKSSTTRKSSRPPSSTKRMLSSSTTTVKTKSSTSTTEKTVNLSSRAPQPSSSSTSSTSKRPSSTTSGPSTSVKPTKMPRKPWHETEKNSTQSQKIIFEDGQKKEITFENNTITDLDYMLLENGLQFLVRNRTVVELVKDAVNSLPSRSGGMEGRLAHRVLRTFGEDTTDWMVQHKGSSRAMTYSTLRRNLVHILRYVVAAIIRKNCKHCVKVCKKKKEEEHFPDDDLVCSDQDKSNTTSTTTTTTMRPRTTTTRSWEERVCQPCSEKIQRCPAPPGCMQYTCALSIEACEQKRQREKEDRTSTTTRAPTTTTTTTTTSTSVRPDDPKTTAKPPSSSTTTTTAPTTSRPKRDPDFEPDDETAPAAGERTTSPMSGLYDLDVHNQVPEEERFRELACNGSICAEQSSCGLAERNTLSKKQAAYIVNGETAQYGEWPSYAKLLIRLPSMETSLCGGVLVGKRHVLTAGHCVRAPKKEADAPDEGFQLEPSQLDVVLGDHSRDGKDQFEVTHKVEKICFSSKFNDPDDEGSRFDFAVLTLKEEAKLNDYVQPACLPYKPFPIGKSKCFVVGLGKMRQHDSDNLVTAQFLQKLAVSRKVCTNWGINEHDRSRWCFTRTKGPGDSCLGDSGGPVLCKSKDNKWYVMGLVSYGSEFCDGAEAPGWVAVYSRVPSLLQQMHLDCLSHDK